MKLIIIDRPQKIKIKNLHAAKKYLDNLFAIILLKYASYQHGNYVHSKCLQLFNNVALKTWEYCPHS